MTAGNIASRMSDQQLAAVEHAHAAHAH